jgi:hypothetical protein
MNNSIERLIDGMVATLRREVIPATGGEFARGQAFGVIYMLESLKLRVDWSGTYRSEQAAAWDELKKAVANLALPKSVGAIPGAADEGDAWVCNAYDRLSLAETGADAVKAALDAYVGRCLKHEIATSARPMFAEISLGREENAA